MNPTLRGRHARITCVHCQAVSHVDEAFVVANASSPCWHCGARVTSEIIGRQKVQPADRIRVVPIGGDALRCGDLVAYRGDDGVSVKRVLAVPGQTVGVDAKLNLFISDTAQASGDVDLVCQGQSPFDPPIIPVDFDGLRHNEDPSGWNQTRWRPAQVSSGWVRNPDTHTWRHRMVALNRAVNLSGSSDPSVALDWLVYEHRSVYRGNVATTVNDDYPGNWNEQRRLFEAAAVGTHLVVHPSETRAAIRVRQAGAAFANATIAVGIPMDRECEVTELSVWRRVFYRLSPKHDPSIYPRVMPPQGYFLVGDNVPVSVDSRDQGPIALERMIGRIDAVYAGDATRSVTRFL